MSATEAAEAAEAMAEAGAAGAAGAVAGAGAAGVAGAVADAGPEGGLAVRGLALILNPAAEADEGWRARLAAPSAASASEGADTPAPSAPSAPEAVPPALAEALWGAPAFSRLLFDAEGLGWPSGHPFASPAGRALLLPRADSVRFARHLGLACHRAWHARLIDGRAARRLAEAYDEADLAFLAEPENPFTTEGDIPWRSAPETLALGLRLWERLLLDGEGAWRRRLRLRFPPELPAAPPPPPLADLAWPSRLLQRLFPQWRWLQS